MIPSAPLEDVFLCAECSAPLTLAEDRGRPKCAGCGWVAGYEDGVLDFVRDPERESEREYYEAEYASEPPAERRPVAELAAVWDDASKPVNRMLIRHIGDIRGSRVLLIGNGGSPKELHFLELEPELMVFSDLAPAGVRSVKDQVELDRFGASVCFAAIDALALPMQDESVDLVYGNAIVHHLPDRDRFLSEVARVLKPGGRALFLDAGYAPAWQRAKTTLLSPLMKLSHRMYPRSPEDQRDTLEGGFHEEQLGRTITALGGEPYFERQGLLFYAWKRGVLVLLPTRLRHVGDNKRIGHALTRIDAWLARFRFFRENQVRLLWGFTKRGARGLSNGR